MFKPGICWPALVLLMMMSPLAPAAVVEGLYSAEVEVADQSAQALASASKVAMAEVLVKVSGSSTVLRYPEVSKALSGARKRVQQYSYKRDERAESGLVARFQFDDSYITELVREAGAPLWTANRPQVLVWLAVEDADGRRVISEASDPDISRQLKTEFSRRGVPLQLPLYDTTDAAAISVDQVWRLDRNATAAASQRYQVKDILVGRMQALPEAGPDAQADARQVDGSWRYLTGDTASDQSATRVETAVFMSTAVALVAEDLAGRYAVAASGNSFGGVSMSVTGVESYADYAGIVAWLEKLELVDHANVERVVGQVLQLRLQSQADAEQLASLISLNPRLEPMADEPSSGTLPPPQYPGVGGEYSPGGSTAVDGELVAGGAVEPVAVSRALEAELRYRWIR